jgi:hypothetical protein
MEKVLENETRVYESHLSEWRQTHVGEYVLIKDDEVVGFYPSLSEAFDEGTKRFNLSTFFVKQIVPEDAVNISFLGRHLRSASNS